MAERINIRKNTKYRVIYKADGFDMYYQLQYWGGLIWRNTGLYDYHHKNAPKFQSFIDKYPDIKMYFAEKKEERRKEQEEYRKDKEKRRKEQETVYFTN